MTVSEVDRVSELEFQAFGNARLALISRAAFDVVALIPWRIDDEVAGTREATCHQRELRPSVLCCWEGHS